MNALDMSMRQVLKTVTDGGIVLAHATAARMVAARTLTPASRDSVRHVCDSGSRAGRRPRLGGYVTGMGTTRGVPPPEGVELQERYRGWFCWFLQQKIDGLPSR
jgi:hypothetical protein